METADTNKSEHEELPGGAPGRNPNGGLCYAFGILFPLLYLLTTSRRQSNFFLRFHSFQCLLLWIIWAPMLSIHFARLKLLVAVICALGLGAWLTAWIMASRRKMFRLPFIGALAERLASI